MGEVREKKELRLELTKMRNPHLEEGFGNTQSRRKGETSGVKLRTEGKFVEEKAYPRSTPRSRGRFVEEEAYPRAIGQVSGRRTGAGTYAQPAGQVSGRRTGAGTYAQPAGQGSGRRAGAGTYAQPAGQGSGRRAGAGTYAQPAGQGSGRRAGAGASQPAGQGSRGRAAVDTYPQSAGIRVETNIRVQRAETARERQKRLQQLQRRRKLTVVLIASFAAVCLFWWMTSLFLKKGGSIKPVNASGTVSVGDNVQQKESRTPSQPEKPDWTENYLTPNDYSRPGESLERVDNIFVHYTANAGTSAAQNRSYFEQLKDTHERYASAHFIIGYEGEILQVIPLDEIGCAVQTRNYDSISIECCYLAEDGSFTKETYESLINLLTWLLYTYDLEPEDILRHYDCGGKKCPLYYTEHVDEWEKLKEEVGERLAGNDRYGF